IRCPRTEGQHGLSAMKIPLCRRSLAIVSDEDHNSFEFPTSPFERPSGLVPVLDPDLAHRPVSRTVAVGGLGGRGGAIGLRRSGGAAVLWIDPEIDQPEGARAKEEAHNENEREQESVHRFLLRVMSLVRGHVSLPLASLLDVCRSL